MTLVLASASPRRKELLSAAGFAFDVDVANVDETLHAGEAPEDYARRVAFAKARVVARRRPEAIVIGADTIVVVDDHVLGKPVDDADARRMLEQLSGRAHRVLTAVAVVAPAGESGEIVETRVWMQSLAPEEIAEYVASGEPRDKAGAYAIQGRASRFIPRIEGEYSNVVGLPISAVSRLLRNQAVVS